MLEENRALQRQLLQKHAKELKSLRRGDGWDDSIQSKEQIEASLLSKYEAAMRRERALAYSYSHQQTWNKSSRSSNLLFMDPTNVNTNGETNSTSGVLASAIVAVVEAGEKSDGEVVERDRRRETAVARLWTRGYGRRRQKLCRSFGGSTGRRRTPFSSYATTAAWSVVGGYRDGYSASNGETPATLAAAPRTSSSHEQNDDWHATSPVFGEHRSSYGGALPLVNGDWCAAVASFSNISSSLPVQALPPPHPGNPSHPNKHIFSCTSPATIGKLTIPATSSNFHGFRV
nr:protein IQ-DOMAIN 1-like [Ipomoea batatas]